MTQEHPITPPPELVQEWANSSPIQHSDEWDETDPDLSWAYELFIAHQAARWGADQELEACSQWIHGWYGNGSREVVGNLYAARRPKPPSLKEQALIALETWAEDKYGIHKGLEVGLIHRALEQLDD